MITKWQLQDDEADKVCAIVAHHNGSYTFSPSLTSTTISTDATQKDVVHPLYVQYCDILGLLLPLDLYTSPFPFLTPKPVSSVIPALNVSEITGFSGYVIAISNYPNPARSVIKSLITQMGATYTPSFSSANTHLITCLPTGEKYIKAKEWGTQTVNHLWLVDCIKEGGLVGEANEKYVLFCAGICEVLGETLEVIRDLDVEPFPKRVKVESAKKTKPVKSTAVKEVNTPKTPAKQAVTPKKKIIKYITTSIRPTPAEISQLHSRGFQPVQDIESADCLITSRFFRTEKTLLAICHGVPIVSLPSLLKTLKSQPIEKQDLDEYLVHDPEAEEKFEFSLVDALEAARQGHYLEGKQIWFGKVSMDPVVLRQVVEASGATVAKKRANGVICVGDDREGNRKGEVWYSLEAVLTGVLRQELDEAFLL